VTSSDLVDLIMLLSHVIFAINFLGGSPSLQESFFVVRSSKTVRIKVVFESLLIAKVNRLAQMSEASFLVRLFKIEHSALFPLLLPLKSAQCSLFRIHGWVVLAYSAVDDSSDFVLPLHFRKHALAPGFFSHAFRDTWSAYWPVRISIHGLSCGRLEFCWSRRRLNFKRIETISNSLQGGLPLHSLINVGAMLLFLLLL